MSKIVIDGDKVTMVREIVEKTTSYEAFMEQVLKGAPISIPFLPRQAVGFLSVARSTLFLIHQEPRIQYIRYKYSSGEGAQILPISVALPHIYFIVDCVNAPPAITSLNMFFSPKEIRTLDDELGIIGFPNIHGDNRLPTVCLGSNSGIQITDDVPLHIGVGELINGFWTSLFNRDLLKTNDPPDVLAEAIKRMQPAKMKKIIEDKGLTEPENSEEIGKVRYMLGWASLTEEEGATLQPKIVKTYREWIKLFQKESV